METRDDNVRAIALTVLLHAGLLGFLILSALFSFSREATSAAGEPIQATLQFSAADVRRAQQAVKHSPPPKPDEPESAPPPQPEPSPRPQDSDTPLQPTPQAPQDQPDTVDQVAIDRNALLKAEKEKAEQEERTRQEQVDLTEDIARQQDVERKQRLREQMEALKREQDLAARNTKLQEQRLAQLQDAQPQPAAASTRAPATPQAGNRGEDEGLKARYIAALNATARANWNTSLAQELTRCTVRVTQAKGGTVINVEFTQCGYDAQGRESVERAFYKSPMPYSGFETVFDRQFTLTLCFPEEACLQ